VIKYLEASAAGVQTEDLVKDTLAALDHFKITAAEKLQLINLRAASMVEVHAVSKTSCFLS